MAQDVEVYVKSCPRCLWFKKLPERATLNPIEMMRPLELIHIDYLMIEAPKNSRSQIDVNILIVTDHKVCTGVCYSESKGNDSCKNTLG